MFSYKKLLTCITLYYLNISQSLAFPSNVVQNKVKNSRLQHRPLAFLQYKQSTSKHGILSWTQTEKNSYVHGGIDFSDGSYLILPSSGYYDVQTRIQMDTYTLDMPPSKELLMRLAVNVMDQNGNVRTLVEEKFILGPKHMFGKQLGPATFYLSKGSAVYVVMNNHECINPSKHNMFGVKKWFL
ncbi:uncharacterized protein LOC125668166 isoform X2 [Ostrea edulis]|uniref:uncharacterized protein LOC125668166 isoform X2 n=1 Tax=Ostrea edulis TaxID=37623 RepID=UPI0020955147|nr:uncharacterized protein LOC125668166 isoform X2 [Ostrea edulis]